MADQIGFASFNRYDNPPSNLLAGSYPVENRTIVLLGGRKYLKGHVLGRLTAAGPNRGKVTVASLDNGATPPVATADGTQKVAGILEFDVDATAGDTNASMYVSGDFDGAQLVLGSGLTLANLDDAIGDKPIFVKSVTLSY